MKDILVFYRDNEENVGKYPLSSNIAKMEWDDDWEWPLRVTFWHGGTYEYDVNRINLPFAEELSQYSDKTYGDINNGSINGVWTLLKQGARWSKGSAKTGEYTRGSHGAAFDYLIKQPIGNDKSLYRKVK